MARNKWSIRRTITTPVNPQTLVQIITAANHRAVLAKLEIIPQGSTSASAPMVFDLIKQDDAGSGSSDISATANKDPGQGSDCAIVTLVRAGHSVEPTPNPAGGQGIREWGIHQQGVRVIDGADEEIVLEANTRYGIRKIAGDNVSVRVHLVIEE